MNTVFKFHENAWLLAGLAAGVGLALIGRFTLRARWIVAALRRACSWSAGLVYPLSRDRDAAWPSGRRADRASTAWRF